MIKLLGTIPRHTTVACSGGVDSMALLDFLNRNHTVTAAFFNHRTHASREALEFLDDYCSKNRINLEVGTLGGTKPPGLSKEEWWRNCRYEWLDRFPHVATAHHLDDAVETWIWSSLHGCSSLLPYRRGNVVRPLLLNRKYELEKWAADHGVPWIVDVSNNDTSYTRNYIRHELMSGVLRVNPGIHTMIRKKLVKRGVADYVEGEYNNYINTNDK